MNKDVLKKVVIPVLIFVASEVLVFSMLTKIQYEKYTQTTNKIIAGILEQVMEKYPDTDEQELIKILNNKNNVNDGVLLKYGYTQESQYIVELKDNMNTSVIANMCMFLVMGITALTIAIFYNHKEEKRIEEINKYLIKLNNKNYELKIEDNGEDELSKLRNELYKTTVLLKENAEKNENEKINLENSLADISHQLKTPITSIRIMLDNIEENPQMDEKTRNEFLKDISRQVDWISSLVISLLKLAKFDAGSIKMVDIEFDVNTLIENVISNLAILLDIKNIKIEKSVPENTKIKADYKWQLEAITNIVKNAIEHSKEDTCIHINVENSSVFVKVKIQDEGEGIEKQDLKNIFKRFYKVRESSEGSSIGIGLSLAKTIIEKENGYIKVESEKGKGTTFIIKYLK